jgi:hypothetical protein
MPRPWVACGDVVFTIDSLHHLERTPFSAVDQGQFGRRYVSAEWVDEETQPGTEASLPLVVAG